MKQLNFPALGDVEEALRRHLAEHGPCRVSDAREKLADHFGLTEAQRAATPMGSTDPVWSYLVRWARQSLKNKGLLAETPRGVWDLMREQEMQSVRPRVTHSASDKLAKRVAA